MPTGRKCRADFSPAEAGAGKKVAASKIPADEDDRDFELDQNDEADDEEGGVAVEADEEPEADWLEQGEHPLAANYLCAGTITLTNCGFTPTSPASAATSCSATPIAKSWRRKKKPSEAKTPG